MRWMDLKVFSWVLKRGLIIFLSIFGLSLDVIFRGRTPFVVMSKFTWKIVALFTENYPSDFWKGLVTKNPFWNLGLEKYPSFSVNRLNYTLSIYFNNTPLHVFSFYAFCIFHLWTYVNLFPALCLCATKSLWSLK